MERQESCVENAVFFEFPILTGYFNLNDDQSPMGTEVGRAKLLGLPSISADIPRTTGSSLPRMAARW
tara:strand:+ start:255 stop:455 length:201 start_codon:yes stop_codon:yes gene_type:complete